MDPANLRAQFPVLADCAYLNAGTDGPLPAAAVEAADRELRQAAAHGRTKAHFERRSELAEELRAGYAAALGASPAEVALTTCTSDGLSVVVDGLGLSAGDEILTSDEEHPGLLGALAAAREISGVTVRMGPLSRLAEHVGGSTRLVACSHVSWLTGGACDPELAKVDVPVVLDGAQGVGAVPVDLEALGCDAYAGAGQKWLCGPDGLGMLWVSPPLRERLAVRRRGYPNLADPSKGLSARMHEDARRFDTLALGAGTLAAGVASWRILKSAGLAELQAQAVGQAGRLAQLLAHRGREVATRSPTTLVSFASEDPQAEVDRLAQRGVVVRDLPGTPWLRASVGAWNDENDLKRLLDALAG